MDPLTPHGNSIHTNEEFERHWALEIPIAVANPDFPDDIMASGLIEWFNGDLVKLKEYDLPKNRNELLFISSIE
ncbi:hypothetical protein J2S78_002073 [Salibacterium salarium]|uniref:hypothetical protein n=1 Tax=Salibacterium salarium TaxID=284579 RepID=UPI00277E807E|nr:hypothetical protein [Salibacterium salarium]MDQ0299653.1 hypothetical protein [Salibacterium salarium]